MTPLITSNFENKTYFVLNVNLMIIYFFVVLVPVLFDYMHFPGYVILTPFAMVVLLTQVLCRPKLTLSGVVPTVLKTGLDYIRKISGPSSAPVNAAASSYSAVATISPGLTPLMNGTDEIQWGVCGQS